MTLILTEGFETYDDATQFQTKWTTHSNGTLLMTVPRTGLARGAALVMTKQVPAGEDHATFVAGFAHYVNTPVAGDLVRFMSDAGATEHVVLRRGASGQLAIDRGGTILATTAGNVVPPDAVWRYVEIKATLSDTVGTIDVYLNGDHGTPVLTFSGDTKNAGAMTTFDTLSLNNTSNGVLWDDIYFLTGGGSAPANDLLGEVRCWPLSPSGNGNSSQLLGSDGNSTDNYLLIDEAPNVTSSADYVGSAVAGDKDTYVYGDLTPSTGTVVSVEVSSQVYKSDAGAKSFRPVVRHSGTDYAGTDVVLALGTVRSAEVFVENPGTTAAWTISDVNAAEFGAEART